VKSVRKRNAMTETDSITINSSPRKALAKLTILAIGLTAAAAIVVPVFGFFLLPPLWAHAETVIICIAALMAVWVLLAALGITIGHRPRVEIGPESFVTQGIVGRRSRRWSDVAGEFTVVTVKWQRHVAYRLTREFKESTPPSPSAAMAGYDEAIIFCGELSIGAQQLADLLNQWKQRAPTRPPAE